MALIMRLIDQIHYHLDKHADPRSKNYPLMSSPFTTLAICLSYAYFVKVIGPKFMENRKPFQLRKILIWYNLAQVIFSLYLFLGLAFGGWFTGRYSFSCQPVDFSNSPEGLWMVHMSWMYYFAKFTEFLDTIFFVLRKKNQHISTLHVIHHGCMPMSVWFGVKMTPGGHATFFGMINSFVHVIMYTYYLLSALGPQFQPYLWWKKYLTAFQMVQFIIITIHAFQLLFIDCNFPKGFVWFIGMHAIMFLFLFKDFYDQTYRKKASKKAAVANGKANGAVAHNDSTTNGSIKQQNGIANSYVSTESDVHFRSNKAQ